MKSTSLLIFAGILLITSLAWASDPGITTRASDLFQEPTFQSEKLGTLDKDTKVLIIRREGGWYLIYTDNDGEKGWVRMLSIRLGDGEKKQGDSGISALSQFARTGQSGQVVATGVRGLSEENIKEAKPNIQELKKMQAYEASKNEARVFARQNSLQSRDIAYLEESKKSDDSGSNSFSFSE